MRSSPAIKATPDDSSTPSLRAVPPNPHTDEQYRAQTDPAPALLAAMMGGRCTLASIRKIVPLLREDDPENPWDRVILRHVLAAVRDSSPADVPLIHSRMRDAGEYSQPGRQELAYRLTHTATPRVNHDRIGPLAVALVAQSLRRRVAGYGGALTEGADTMSDHDLRHLIEREHAEVQAHYTRLDDIRKAATTA